MGFEALTHEIEKKAAEEARKILHDAQLNAKGIISKAEEESKKGIAAAKSEVSSFLESERAERLTSAKLACSKILAEAKEQAVENSLSNVWEEMLKRRTSTSYKKLLHLLAQSAVEELGVPNAVICTNASDRRHFAGTKYGLGEPIACAGGLVAQKKDGSVRVDMTFEAIFAQKREDLRKQIFGMLF